MSTIFKTRISQQEVQTPVVSADTVVTDNFITSSIQSESVASENINATIVQGEEIIANDLSTENIAISNDLSIGQDVIVPSGNVLVGRRGIVSFVDDGEEVDENGASGFPIYNGVPEILNNSTVYNIGEIDKDIDLSNIRFGGNDNMVQTCEIWFSVGNEAYDIYWPENMLWLDSTDGNAPAIVVRTEYRVVIRKEINGSMVASIAYAIGEGSEIVSGNMMEGVARLDADNTFTADNTFMGVVDMSGAQVTPPEGWNVEGGAELTAEAVQGVLPILLPAVTTPPTEGYAGANIIIGNNAKSTHQWGVRNVIIGNDAKITNAEAVAIGSGAISAGGGVTLGTGCSSSVGSCIVMGQRCVSFKASAIVIGLSGNVSVNGTNKYIETNSKGSGSVVIGAHSRNRSDNNIEPSNAVTIGYLSETNGADSVVIGAHASGSTANVAIGAGAKAADLGAVVFASRAADGSKTQLYFSGANTPLANTYENGEAMMGYVVTDSAGNVMVDAEGNAMVGTQKLSVLFPNNRGENAFTPAMLGLDDEWTPKSMFRPSDLDMPQEEPTEPEEYQPLPVYPIVEPEIEEI